MVDALTPYQALLLCIERAGSQAALARIAGVSSTAVWKWVQIAARVPAEFVLRIEAATGVSRHVIRPDIYPVERRRRSVKQLDRGSGAALAPHRLNAAAR